MGDASGFRIGFSDLPIWKKIVDLILGGFGSPQKINFIFQVLVIGGIGSIYLPNWQYIPLLGGGFKYFVFPPYLGK